MLLTTDYLLLTAYYSLLTTRAPFTQLIGLLRNAPLDLVSVIDDFGGLIYAEIDYEVEAANAARFSRLYSQLPNVTAPSIFLPLSTSKVLTVEC